MRIMQTEQMDSFNKAMEKGLLQSRIGTRALTDILAHDINQSIV